MSSLFSGLRAAISWITGGTSVHNNNTNNNTADASDELTGRVADGIFKCDFPQFKDQLYQSTNLCPDTVQIVIGYLASKDNPFGAADWIKHGFDPGLESKLSQEFYQRWYGPDADDVLKHKTNPNHPIRRAYETHLPPVLITEKISLGILEQIGLKYSYDTEALQQNREKKADLTCWLVLRKGVVARNESPDNQKKYIQVLNRDTGANYEEMPSVIDLACVVFARFLVTGERHLGDDTGAEKRLTYSRVKQTIKFFGNTEYHLVVGCFAPGGLGVRSSSAYGVSGNDGMTILGKF